MRTDQIDFPIAVTLFNGAHEKLGFYSRARRFKIFKLFKCYGRDPKALVGFGCNKVFSVQAV